jgi:hypothetical protein
MISSNKWVDLAAMLQLNWKGFYVFSQIDQTKNRFGNNRKYMFSLALMIGEADCGFQCSV